MNPKRQNLDGVNQSIWSDHSIDPKEWTDNLTTYSRIRNHGKQGGGCQSIRPPNQPIHSASSPKLNKDIGCQVVSKLKNILYLLSISHWQHRLVGCQVVVRLPDLQRFRTSISRLKYFLKNIQPKRIFTIQPTMYLGRVRTGSPRKINNLGCHPRRSLPVHPSRVFTIAGWHPHL